MTMPLKCEYCIENKIENYNMEIDFVMTSTLTTQ